jgi:glycosyltransferase involved in cell wall biosynthesis
MLKHLFNGVLPFMKQFNKKIAYITSRFPPLNTETYHVLDVQAFENMGLDVTIFSRINMSGMEGTHDIRHVKSPVINLPERILEDNPPYEHSLLNTLDDYANKPEKLVAELNKDEKLKQYVEQILEAVEYYHYLPSYQSAREQLEKNLAMPQSPINHGQHVMMFLQGLCLAHYMEKNNIPIAYAQSFSRTAQNAHYASLISQTSIYWITQGHNQDTLILNDEEIRYRFKYADAVTAESEVARKAFERAKVDISNVPIVYRGIDTIFFVPLRDSRESEKSNGIEIITVARAAEKKGLNHLIEALKFISEDLSVHITHIGDGPLLESLKRQAIELGVDDRITFLGNVSSKSKILEHLQNSDIFISPNITSDNINARLDNRYGIIQDATDGLQSAILEAAATGLPVIATNAGGNKDFVNQNNGIIVRERNAQELADAIYDLAKNPEKRKILGKQARTDVLEKFDYKTSQELLVKIFEKLI